MALKLNERYPGRFDSPTAGYPQGSFKNRTTPDAKDGSYLEKDWANDKEGFFQSLLNAAGFVANGAVDSVGASQYYSALTAIIGTLAPAPPDASTTEKGVVELATNTEAQAGVDSVRAVTPASLASVTATVARAGLVELATDAETQAGTDAQRAVTPASLSARTGTESRSGVLQLATQAEALAGTESTKAVSVIRIWQAITSRFATQAQVNAGTDDTTMVTPLKLRFGFAASIGLNGYIAFPTWLGSLIFQWMFTTSTSTNHVLTLPLAAPTELLVVIPTCQATGAGTANIATWDRAASTLSSVRISTTGVNNIAIFVVCR